MPILKREPDLFPPEIFVLPAELRPWWVAHVRSRQEKALARYLKHFHVPFYLPLRERRVRRNGRFYTSLLPLFTGYVFMRGCREERLEALRSELLVRILEVRDQNVLTLELQQLHDLQERGVSLAPHPYVAPGDRVRVADGPFKGYLGVVVREKARQRLVVSVSTLRRSLAVELGREDVDVVGAVT
jgi:transcription antitermination factor NusG